MRHPTSPLTRTSVNECSNGVLGHASAAMTLDRYADLFDSDLAGASPFVHGVPRHWKLRLVQPSAARLATVATSDFTTDAGTGVPTLKVSTSASINGPVMNATVTYTTTIRRPFTKKSLGPHGSSTLAPSAFGLAAKE
jgi:hypothetical protein